MLTPHPTPYTLREKREELYINWKDGMHREVAIAPSNKEHKETKQ